MILTDAEIVARIASDQVLEDYDPKNVQNCGCALRAGAAFEPATGKELVLGQVHDGTRQVAWELGPNETLVIMTRELVKVPSDLCAVYAPLYRLATQGVMLLNPAVVEPHYQGPLSCFLVNFSSQRVHISPNEPISKIVFHELSAAPKAPKPLSISRDDYSASLARHAARFHRSFLDVTGIEDRAVEKAQQATKRAAIVGGIAIAVLLLWASLEPVLSKWIWEKTGVITATQRTADAVLLRDLEAARAMLGSTAHMNSLETRSLELQKELAVIKEQLAALMAAQNARPSRP